MANLVRLRLPGFRGDDRHPLADGGKAEFLTAITALAKRRRHDMMAIGPVEFPEKPLLLKLMMSPAGYRFDRWMVRWTGDSPLTRVFARQGGYPVPRMPLLLVAKGRKSGKDRQTVLAYFEIDGRLILVGSAGGSPKEPDWVGNLRANPAATIYIARKPRRVTARIAVGDERRDLWEKLIATAPTYAQFQAAISREIPLVILS